MLASPLRKTFFAKQKTTHQSRPTIMLRGLAFSTLLVCAMTASTPPPHWQRRARRSLFVLSSVNPALAVLSNDYKARRIDQVLGIAVPTADVGLTGISGVAPWLFSVVLRPRVMFTIGALLRVLQLTTPLRWLFNPSCGIAAGTNLLCLWSNSAWPATIVLGWVTSPALWAALGDESPDTPPVPIFHANTLPVNLTHPVGTEGAERPLRVDVWSRTGGRR
jgi:hypothetical protein